MLVTRVLRHALIAVAVTFSVALPGVIHSTNALGATDAKRLAKGDREFLISAAQANWAEIEMGKLAQTRGASDQVRQFGKRMLSEHSVAEGELAALAKQLGVVLSREPDSKYQGDVKTLSQASGAEFDRLFAGYMVRDHERAVGLFEAQAKNGEESAVRRFAAKYLPHLQEHLKAARALEQR